jgi:spore maturation protein SpmB
MIAVEKIGPAVREGFQRGLRGTLWMLKILVPCSFLTFVVDVSGLLDHLDFMLAPAMGFLSLPPEAALPLTAGLLAGIYGAVAALAVLDFSMTETILIAVFLLISHNIIQEGIVQARSGLNFFKATLVRLAASVATVLCLARLLPLGAPVDASIAVIPRGVEPFGALLQGWLWDTGILCLQIFVIITAMMVVMELMRAAHVIPLLARLLRPVLWLMGLSHRVGILWLTAAVFGLGYGAAVIVEETRAGTFEKGDIERLQLSIGINHALIEDPAIFLALGIPAIWLWVPRLVAALAVVHLYRLWTVWQRRRRARVSGEAAAKPVGRSI